MMTKSRTIVALFTIIIWCACSKKKQNYPVLQLTPDELVKVMVNMYSINSAIQMNDLSFRDSTGRVYFEQLATMTGKPLDVIKSDFDKLLKMPDSLLVIQNRALDTLRSMQDKVSVRPKISIGIN
ncbi:MAG: hypothetical protein IPL08_02305 [Saprospiraceae bacterium]|nr:hypothetical protein [Saprospiraceae bacterium]